MTIYEVMLQERLSELKGDDKTFKNFNSFIKLQNNRKRFNKTSF